MCIRDRRWPGGMLTNFVTIRKAVKKMSAIDRTKEDGTFETLSKKEKLIYLDELAENSKGRIEYFETDLLIDGSYQNAMEGCELVFHIASPFIMDSKDPLKEVIDPALNGTKNVLNSVNVIKSVKKVVVKSSVADIN